MKDLTPALLGPAAEHPGFWQVPVGVLMEVGDQYVDRQGVLQALPLDQVGRPVAGNLVILRIERRHGPR